MRLFVKIFAFSLLFFIFIYVLIYFKQTFNYYSHETSLINRKEIQCQAFDFAAKNFRIKINGVVYPQSIPLYLNETINFSCLNSNWSKRGKILFWTPFFGNKKFSFGIGYKQPFIDNECPVYNCEIFNDKSRVNQADIVIVHMRDQIKKFPEKRPKNQRWIFAVYESPMHCGNFTKYNNLFNFTSTYRIDSDFPRLTGSYKKFVWGFNKSFNENRDFSHGKTHFAAAIIGNCGGSSGRLTIIKKIQKFIPVTLLGRCGTKCTDFFKNSSNQDCKELVAQSHKFYFSFENSICNGYISKKFFQILRYDIITVVFGDGNYSHFVRIF